MLMEVVGWLRESGLDVEQQQVGATAGEGTDPIRSDPMRSSSLRASAIVPGSLSR